ncbi:RHS repeat-associated core domain-containing protein, partial [Pantoea stewartii]
MTFMTSPEATRLIRHGHSCLGVAGPAGLTLTAGGHNDSLLWSRNPASGSGQLHTWSPWGNGKAEDDLPGFNGERCDPVSGSYHLGNGYRAYNPVLRRFNCPDSLSPFGAGGINPYAYCAGDPVNHTDPTGHISWQGFVGIVAGAIGVLLTGGAALGAIATAGSVAAAWSAASTTTLVVGGMGLLADATGIASGATEDSNPQASSVLGWVSMATGIAGMAAGFRQMSKKMGEEVPRSALADNEIMASTSKIGNDIKISKKPLRDLTLLGSDSYIFTDLYKGQSRLNIVAHGNIIGEKSYLKINGRLSSPKETYNLLSAKVNIDNYSTLRIISCYSADGPDSFSSQMRALTGKTVKGFFGKITVLDASQHVDSLPSYISVFNKHGINGNVELTKWLMKNVFSNGVKIYKDES